MSSPATTRPDPLVIPAVRRPATTKPPFPSTWACKVTMAITGAIFGVFVTVHMIGNLHIYMPSPAGEPAGYHLDEYAHWLRTVFEPLLPYEGLLWIMRIVLAACLVLHIGAALVIRLRGRASRGTFKRRGMEWKSFAARNMLVTGVVLFLFICFHIMDLTLGVKPIASGDFEHLAAYNNVIHSFDRPWVALFYMLAMVLLFLHLSHGLWSVVNDLGATGHRFRQVCYVLAWVIGAVVAIGNITIPIAVMAGWLA